MIIMTITITTTILTMMVTKDKGYLHGVGLGEEKEDNNDDV